MVLRPRIPPRHFRIPGAEPRLPTGTETDYVWLLSGGGAKGCFQAGAIYYLAREEPVSPPSLICATSVGAVNSLLPAHGWADTPEYIDRLIELWLDMRQESDMYTLSPEAQALEDNDLIALIQFLIDLNISDIANIVLDKPYGLSKGEYFNLRTSDGQVETVGLAFGFLAVLPVAQQLVASPSVHWSLAVGGALYATKTVNQMIELAKRVRSVFTLQPTREILQRNLDIDRMRSRNGIDVHLVSVSLDSGNTCWINEDGMFHEIVARDRDPRMASNNYRVDSDTVRAGSIKDVIVDAVLASSAIPLAFEPVTFITNTQSHTCVDGGVTDTLPTQSAIWRLREVASRSGALIRTRPGVIAIHCSPLHRWNVPGALRRYEPPPTGEKTKRWHTAVVPADQEDRYVGTHVLDIALQGMKLKFQETTDTDMLDIYALPFDVDEITIAPSFKVNATTQIDPGLIRIQLAYGWMRAFDEIEGRRNRSLAEYGAIRANTDAIIRLRMNAWRHELRCTRSATSAPSITWVPGAIRTIRQIKSDIVANLNARVRLAGTQSLPKMPGDAGFLLYWYEGFEQHKSGWPVDRSNNSPWDEHFEGIGALIDRVSAEAPPRLNFSL